MIIGLGALLLALVIYALIDCARTATDRVRGLPKAAWLLIIVLFPIIGALLWLFLGKLPSRSSFGPVVSRPAKAPDDDPEYLSYLDARRRREAETRRREEEREAELDALIDQELEKKRRKDTKDSPEGTSPDEGQAPD